MSGFMHIISLNVCIGLVYSCEFLFCRLTPAYKKVDCNYGGYQG